MVGMTRAGWQDTALALIAAATLFVSLAAPAHAASDGCDHASDRNGSGTGTSAGRVHFQGETIVYQNGNGNPIYGIMQGLGLTAPVPANQSASFVVPSSGLRTVGWAADAAAPGTNVTLTCIEPQPVISSMDVASGSVLGGTSVTVLGSFLRGTTLSIGGVPVPLVYTGSTGDSGVTFVTPSHTVGSAQLLFTNRGRTVVANFEYVPATPTLALTSSSNPAAAGSSATISATLSGGFNPTGSVSFFRNGVQFASAAVSGGGASISYIDQPGYPVSPVGSHTITATYSGDSNNVTASSGALAQTVVRSAPTIVLTAGTNPSVAGELVSYQAALGNGPYYPSGSVRIMDGATEIGFIPDIGVGGVNSANLRLPAAIHSLTAVYAGDANNEGATSAAISVAVTGATPTISVSASANPTTFGAATTLTATLASGFSASGAVTFYDGGVSLGTGTVSGTTASIAVSNLTIGSHGISAVYSGDANNGGATSTNLTLVVGMAVPGMSLISATPSPSAFGDTVTFNLSVTGGSSPTGTVTLFNGATSLGSGALDINGATSITVSALQAGTYNLTASYGGDGNHGPANGAIVHVVDQAGAAVTLASSSNPAVLGEPVVFTANVLPIAGLNIMSGTVTFLIDGAAQAPTVLSGGEASLSTSLLTSGTHSIVARYDGSPNYAGTQSAALTQSIDALGSIIIRQKTDGADGTFGFSSATGPLNLSVATVGGTGDGAPISLPAGAYAITAADMGHAGFALSQVYCSDTNSNSNLAARTANINLDVGEALVCTFISRDTRKKTTELIESFLSTRADLILANQPDLARRIGRLNGEAASGGNPVSGALGYLPGLIEGTPLSVSTSLSAIDAMAGNREPSRFDAWMDGTFAIVDGQGPQGRFNIVTLGADYLVNADLLIGGLVQLDSLSQTSTLGGATVSGSGWIAGPYVTARLAEHLYLDLLAAAGTSSNLLSPYGTYQDSFDATRWLLSASLEGEWQWDAWTFSPRANLAYFEETSQGYTDSLGLAIPSVTVGMGRLAMGPSVSYRLIANGEITIDAGLRMEGAVDIGNGLALSNWHAQLEGGLDFSFAGGAGVGFSIARDGIGSNRASSTAIKGRLNVPFD